jgi:EAL domain-containing protein (putative c-di-GMP-specific phosphodiesterase class I)
MRAMPSIKFPVEHGSAAPAAEPTPPAPQAARELRLKTARREVTERRRITQKLRQALATGGFSLHYQPIVSLKSGLARGAEALIRLHHSRRGFIPAQHFMPIAERSDVIADVTGWMLQNACAEAALWPEGFTVGVALTLRHLQSGKLVRQLLEALSRSGLAQERLELEVTEAMLIDDSDDTVFALKALRGIGVRLALNNFGTGYASLSALKRLPFATLRLDRSLTQNLGEDEASTAIVNAAIKAGQALGCAVLADGVENEMQFLKLCEIGADEGQGPYFSPAVSAAEMAAMFTHS